MKKLEYQDNAISQSASFFAEAGEHFKVYSCKKNKEFYGPFTMVGKVKDKSSRKDYADIFDVLSSVTNSATMKLFTFIIHHRDEETNIAHMPEWKDLSIEERKTNQKKIAKLIAGNLIIRIPVELKLPIRVEKFTYMINPFYYRPLKYEESKNLWNLIINKGNQL